MARPEHDQQVEEMVKTIKYSAAEELQKYKLSAEDIFNKNVRHQRNITTCISDLCIVYTRRH